MNGSGGGMGGSSSGGDGGGGGAGWGSVISEIVQAAAPAITMGIGAGSSAASTHEQMAFQERMSSTAYQRAVKDMTKAGINPMLAFSQGGASSPAGAKWEVPTVDLTTGAQAAVSRQKGKAETKRLKGVFDLNRQLENKASAEAEESFSKQVLNYALEEKTREEAKLAKNSARSVEADANIKESAIPRAKADEKFDKTTAGRIMRWINRAIRAVTGGDPVGTGR